MNAYGYQQVATVARRVNHYIVFLALLVLYTVIMEHNGGLPSVISAWRMEIPLLLYLYAYFNLISRKSRLQHIAAGAPIFLVYVIFDVYHLLLGRLLRFTEATELPELFMIMPVGYVVLVCLLLVIPIAAFLMQIRFRRPGLLLAGALPLLALLASIEFFPEFYIQAFENTRKQVDWFSDINSSRSNGRVSTALYNEAKRKSALKKAVAYQGDSSYKREFNATVAGVRALPSKHNVHLIVLESFIDPSLLRNARFSKNPVHPEFEAFFKNHAGISNSPMFGGGTAQAEFEVLCGVPAMKQFSGIEFNVFTGAKTLCLPTLLARAGYHTMATNAFVPDFFNSTNAYEGTGFVKVYYADEYAPGCKTYFCTGDVASEKFMFDGDLFSQNLSFVEAWIKANPGRPIFNYINTIYGHTPNVMDSDKRPTVVRMLGKYKDDQLERAANQYYYRTKAIAEFVRGLIRIDPKSIIILVSDHLPPLAHGPLTYRTLNYLGKVKDFLYLNRIYIVESGKPVHYDTIRHYDIPKIILSYLNHTRVDPKAWACAENSRTCPSRLQEQYMTIMANAMVEGPFVFARRHENEKDPMKRLLR